MFKFLQEIKDLWVVNQAVISDLEYTAKKLKTLEDYLDIEYFEGDKQKPHYRKRRVITKKLGRPRKAKKQIND